MRIVDEPLLRSFRERLRCEFCNHPTKLPLQPHHLWCRGMGGGGRLDIRINLIALCGTVGTREGCHDKAHRGEITRSDLLAVVAAREGCLQGDIERTINLLLRTPKEGPMGASGWVHLDVTEVTKETDKAFCVVLADGEELWIPKSQISNPINYQAGDKDCTISVTEWLAQEKGLAG